MQKVVPIKSGSTGIRNFVTIESTIFWNSSSRLVVYSAWFQTAARPTVTEKKRAVITVITGGICSWKMTSGSSRSPSTFGLIERCGKIEKPAIVELKAAPIEET